MSAFETFRKAGDHLAKHLPVYEVILLVLMVIGVIISLSNPWGITLILVAVLVLCAFYLIASFSPFEDENAGGITRIILALSFYFLTIALVGVIFALKRWPLASVFLLTGSILTLISSLYMIVSRMRKPALRIINHWTILRSLIIGIGALLVYVFIFKILNK